MDASVRCVEMERARTDGWRAAARGEPRSRSDRGDAWRAAWYDGYDSFRLRAEAELARFVGGRAGASGDAGGGERGGGGESRGGRGGGTGAVCGEGGRR